MSRRLVTMLVFALALALPATAAATTIGPQPSNPDPTKNQHIQEPNETTLFTVSGPGNPPLTSPYDGVITSWTFYSDEIGGQASVQLRMLTAEPGGKTYKPTHSGPLQPLTPVTPTGSEIHNVVHTFAAQIPIKNGELIGYTTRRPAGSTFVSILPLGSNWTTGCFGCSGEPALNGVAATPTLLEGQWVALTAVIEPDVDSDGLGDETQDDCLYIEICGGIYLPPSENLPLSPPKTSTLPPPASTPVDSSRLVTPKAKRCPKGKSLKRGKCVKKKHKPRKKRTR